MSDSIWEKMEDPPIGRRHVNLKKSIDLALQFLLVACHKNEFRKAFASFSGAEQERIFRLYTQVAASFHGNVQEVIETLCAETQVGKTLDIAEQLVEEQHLEPLFSQKTNIAAVTNDLKSAKEKEIQHLQGMLEKVEKEKQLIRARVELLKNEKQDSFTMADEISKMKSGCLSYATERWTDS